MTGRKPKYSPELADLIVEVIAQTGSDKAAIAAAGIRAGTFYRWLNEKSDFCERVAIAKEEFTRTAPETFVSQANQILHNYLFIGHVETWTAKEVHKDTAGNVIKTVERVSKVVKPTPPWAIDRVLGKSYDELEAVKTLVEAGWLPPEILYNCGASMEKLKTEMQQLFGLNLTKLPWSAGAAILQLSVFGTIKADPTTAIAQICTQYELQAFYSTVRSSLFCSNYPEAAKLECWRLLRFLFLKVLSGTSFKLSCTLCYFR